MSTRHEIFGLANELVLDDSGWALLSPFGEHPKTRTVRTAQGERAETWLQVLDRESAEAMAQKFNSPWSRVKRAISSVPVFVRHPDLASVSPETVAENQGTEMPVGSVNRLEVRPKGLYAQISLFPAGRDAVANERLRWMSPFWWVEPIEASGGLKRGRPVELISVGLTDRPNITQGEALDNQRPPEGVTPQSKSGSGSERNQNDPIEEPRMKNLLIGLLAAHGIALANDAKEDDVFGHVHTRLAKLGSDLTALGNEKAVLTTKVATLEGEIAAGKTALAEAKAGAETARTALGNERKQRATLAVDIAILRGQLAPADREARIAKIAGAQDPEAEFTSLANEATRFKTTSATTGDRRADAGVTTADDASKQLLAVANELVRKGEQPDFESAWRSTKQTHTALHEAMAKK